AGADARDHERLRAAGVGVPDVPRPVLRAGGARERHARPRAPGEQHPVPQGDGAHPQPRRRHGLTSASTGVRPPYSVRRPTPGPGADAYGPGHDRGHTCAGVRAAILVARMPESPTGDTPARCRKLALLLVRPSKYDDRGYVIRHWRGVLPSNTLNCLHAL